MLPIVKFSLTILRMDLRRRLQVIHDRVSLAARELELQPEVFQATEELRQAAGDLAVVIQDLDTGKAGDSEAKEAKVPLRPIRQDPADHGTGEAPGRRLPKAA